MKMKIRWSILQNKMQNNLAIHKSYMNIIFLIITNSKTWDFQLLNLENRIVIA